MRARAEVVNVVERRTEKDALPNSDPAVQILATRPSLSQLTAPNYAVFITSAMLYSSQSIKIFSSASVTRQDGILADIRQQWRRTFR